MLPISQARVKRVSGLVDGQLQCSLCPTVIL